MMVSSRGFRTSMVSEQNRLATQGMAPTSNDGEEQRLQCSSSTVHHIQQCAKAICQQEALQGSRALYDATPQGIQDRKVIQCGCLTAHQLQLLQLQTQRRCTLQTASACSVCISSQCVSFRVEPGACSMPVCFSEQTQRNDQTGQTRGIKRVLTLP